MFCNWPPPATGQAKGDRRPEGHACRGSDRPQQETQLASGKQKDIHETMIEMEKADVAFQLLMQVRNKVIAAYETIMRMQA